VSVEGNDGSAYVKPSKMAVVIPRPIVKAILEAVLKIPPGMDCWCFGREDMMYTFRFIYQQVASCEFDVQGKHNLPR